MKKHSEYQNAYDKKNEQKVKEARIFNVWKANVLKGAKKKNGKKR